MKRCEPLRCGFCVLSDGGLGMILLVVACSGHLRFVINMTGMEPDLLDVTSL